jgi:hypothetical protein
MQYTSSQQPPTQTSSILNNLRVVIDNHNLALHWSQIWVVRELPPVTSSKQLVYTFEKNLACIRREHNNFITSSQLFIDRGILIEKSN